jgi:glycosyltransferase involved in cell wall biosynthesis
LRGAEVFAYGLNRKLRSLGHEAVTAYLYPSREDGAFPTYEEDKILGGDSNSIFRPLLGVSPRLLSQLIATIRENRPDVVQVNGGSTVKYGALAKRFSPGAPWVLVYRNIGDPGEWVRTPMQRVYYRYGVMPMVDGVVSVSQACLKQVMRVHAPDAVCKVLPRGVDVDGFEAIVSRDALRSQAGVPPDASVLITVGSLSPEKRVDRLLRVFGKVKKTVKNSFLWIVGDGPQRSNLEKLAGDLGITGPVHFMGVRDDVASCLGAADLFVLASDTEGTPGVILEAGLMGLATVATSVGGVPDCVVTGQTGLLVDPADEEAFAAAITELLQDDSVRASMGSNARQHVRERFSLDRIAGEYVEYYREVIARTRVIH